MTPPTHRAGPTHRALLSPRSLLPHKSDYAGLKQSWRADLVAGVTVGVVALPLALAFGVSSGVGAEAGLITAIVAGLVAAIFGGSNVQVSGPTGAMVVILAPIVVTHGVTTVATLSVMAGIIVMAAGALRLGRTVSYIPWPVIEGFTVGIGVIIFMQQVPAAVGASSEGLSTNALVAAWESVSKVPWPAALLPLAIVAVVAAIMLVLSKISGKLPASFIAIVVVSFVAALAALPVDTIGTLPTRLPAPSLPTFNIDLVASLAGPAFAVAALAAIESLLSARIAASMADTGPVNADRELVGQGLASLASGFFGGMPATGAIARTAVNVRSGARTRAAAVVHALALLTVVYAASTVVALIPLAALAGVLMVTAARMISPAVVRRVLRSTRSDAIVFVVTALITVSFDLIIAVGIGIAAAAFFTLRRLSLDTHVHRETLPGPAMPADDRIALFRIDGALFFAAAERILDEISAQQGTEVVVLRLSQVQHIDATGAHTLAELVAALERRGVTVLIKGVRAPHLRVLENLGAISSLRHPNHLFDDLDAAVAHARSHISRAEHGPSAP